MTKQEVFLVSICTTAGLLPLVRQVNDPLYGTFLTVETMRQHQERASVAVGRYDGPEDIQVTLYWRPLGSRNTLIEVIIATRFNGVAVARSRELPAIKRNFSPAEGYQAIATFINESREQAIHNHSAVLAARAETALDQAQAQTDEQLLRANHGLEFSIYRGNGDLLDGTVHVDVILTPGQSKILRLEGLTAPEIDQTLTFISSLCQPELPGTAGPG